MSCVRNITVPVYVRCGTTWQLSFLYRDKETQTPIVIDDLKARGTVTDEFGNVVLTLSTETTPATLLIPAGEGRVKIEVGSNATQALSPSNVRRELTLYIELYDGSTPPLVTPFVQGVLIAQPDLTP
jgi:hypothetical protein